MVEEVELTLIIGADHRVSFEPAEVAMRAKPEVIFGPLQHPDLIDHSAR